MKNACAIILSLVALSTGCISTYNVLEDTYENRLRAIEDRLKWVKKYVDRESTLYSPLTVLQLRLRNTRPKIDDVLNIWNERVIKPLGLSKNEYLSQQHTLREITYELNAITNKNIEVKKAEMLRQVAQVRLNMSEIGEKIAEIETKIEVIKERFAVDKKRHDLKKEKYREHLLKGIIASGISKDYIYTDDIVVIYLDSINVRKDSATLVIKAYLIIPSRSNSISTGRCDTHISLYNTHGKTMGSPIESNYTQQYGAKGVILNLKYQDNIELGAGALKLVVEKWVIANRAEVIMEIPYKLKEIIPPKLPLERKDEISSIAVKSDKDFVTKIEIIECKRKGNHLVVPVSLNIHGKEIETEMMLDTGASVTTITFGLYKKGNAKPLSELKKEKFETAKGIIQSYIDEVKVSTSAYSKNISIAISNYDMVLLGANYFEGNIFTVDVENERIYVHPKSE